MNLASHSANHSDDRPLLDTLTEEERSQLEEAEAVIRHGLEVFRRVGLALLHIRDRRLYRATHLTFESYCRERWRMARQQAYSLMNSAEIVETLAEHFEVLPSNNAQVKPLHGLEPEMQLEAWDTALKTSTGSITAAHVASVVKTLREARHPRPVLPPVGPATAAARGIDPEAPASAGAEPDPGVRAAPPVVLEEQGGVVAPYTIRFTRSEWQALRELAEARTCSIYRVLGTLIHEARRGH